MKHHKVHDDDDDDMCHRIEVWTCGLFAVGLSAGFGGGLSW
jgi:hypothetical protein